MSADIIDLSARMHGRAMLVSEVPTYHLVYLLNVTPDQLRAALRTTNLQVRSSYGVHVIESKPTPPEAA